MPHIRAVALVKDSPSNQRNSRTWKYPSVATQKSALPMPFLLLDDPNVCNGRSGDILSNLISQPRPKPSTPGRLGAGSAWMDR